RGQNRLDRQSRLRQRLVESAAERRRVDGRPHGQGRLERCTEPPREVVDGGIERLIHNRHRHLRRARTRAGVRGRALPRAPWRPSASATALATAAGAPATPASPPPFTPSGFPVYGTSRTSTSISGNSAAVGMRYSANEVESGWPCSS